MLDAGSGRRLVWCGVPATHRARESWFSAPLGHIGPRGGLDLSSPSALIKVNYLVIRHLHFESVLGDLQEGNGCASRCQLPLSLVPIPTFRAQNWHFCALLPASFSRWWFLGAPSRAQKKSGTKKTCTKKTVHGGECARDGNRTRTDISAHRILSPACLPIPPLEQCKFRLEGQRYYFLSSYEPFLIYFCNLV